MFSSDYVLPQFSIYKRYSQSVKLASLFKMLPRGQPLSSSHLLGTKKRETHSTN